MSSLFARFLLFCLILTLSACSNGDGSSNPGPVGSVEPYLSEDASYLVFASDETDLVAGESSDLQQIYLLQQATGMIRRVSVATDGTVGRGTSSAPMVSADGTKVVFASSADNLVANDWNNVTDVFLHDLTTNTTIRVSDPAAGGRNPSISADGTRIVYISTVDRIDDLFLVDLIAGTTTKVSVGNAGEQGNGNVSNGVIARDGQRVVFDSLASNLVVGDSNGVSDVFVRDLAAATTVRVSFAPDGSENSSSSSAAAISGAGHRVLFYSGGLYMHDLTSGETISIAGGYGAVISYDGSRIAFASTLSDLVPADGNGRPDIFLYNVADASIRRVSVDSSGSEANDFCASPTLSGDGGVVAFASRASNLVAGDSDGRYDIFVHDLANGATIQAPSIYTPAATERASKYPSLSADGTRVAFVSNWPRLLPGGVGTEMDRIFVRDQNTGIVQHLSVSSSGEAANSASYPPAISADGNFVAFYSLATNLDAEGMGGYFIHELATGTTRRISITADGVPFTGGSGRPAISADGRYVAFAGSNQALYRRDTQTNTTLVIPFTLAAFPGEWGSFTGFGLYSSSSINPAISADGDRIAFPVIDHIMLPSGFDMYRSNIFVYTVSTGVTRCVTLAADGTPTYNSADPALSGDGRTVAFSSSSFVVPNDGGIYSGIFVRDLDTDAVNIVSVDSAQGRANDHSYAPALSADGNLVTFESFASNLVANDTNVKMDIFVHNRTTGSTERVSLGIAGQADGYSYNPTISANGQVVAYDSFAPNLALPGIAGGRDIYLHDLSSGSNFWVTDDAPFKPNGASESPAISADGRFVAFISFASNLVAEDTNSMADVFVHDRATGLTELVSVDSLGNQPAGGWYQSPKISADGRYVIFLSSASTLVADDSNGVEDIFVHDRDTGMTERVSIGTGGVQANQGSSDAVISGDGRYVAFASYASNLAAGDTNSFQDVFVRDLVAGVTTRVSYGMVGPANNESLKPSITADGRYVAFESYASNLVAGDTNSSGDIFLYDFDADATTRVSLTTTGGQANGGSHAPSISNDGTQVSFSSSASNLVAGDTNDMPDMFVRNLTAGETSLVSISSTGDPIYYDWSVSGEISGDGSRFVFASMDDNMVADDTNGSVDVFVRTPLTGLTQRVSLTSEGSEISQGGNSPAMSANGRYVAFVSRSDNVVPGDTNGFSDIFVYDLGLDTVTIVPGF